MAGIFALCMAAGGALGFLLLGEEWSALRRIAGGAVGGGGVALLLTFSRLY